jgi:hypothetical protein
MAQKSTNAARSTITPSMARDAVLSVMAKRGEESQSMPQPGCDR